MSGHFFQVFRIIFGSLVVAYGFLLIEIKPLADEIVQQLLAKLGIEEPSQDLTVLARNFLNLSLIGSLVKSGVVVSDVTREVILWIIDFEKV